MLKICVIADYPSPLRPTFMAFVREIVHGFARAGCEVCVIAPEPVPRCWNRVGYPAFQNEACYELGGTVTVYRPATISFGNWLRYSWLGPFNLPRIAARIRAFAVLRTIRKYGLKPNVLYAHFLGQGVVASYVAKRIGVPVFVGVGESSFDYARRVGLAFYRKNLRYVRRFIPNATHFVSVLADVFHIEENRQCVLPNGIDPKLFYPRDKTAARAKYKIQEGVFVVGSTGHFIHRKGLNRVGEAIRDLDGVVGIFAGKGGLPPEGPNVLFKAPVRHEELPEFLSACDVFVLPTLSEGCCNAIAEAMACGLPVISSNNIYVADQLDETCSIRVDPLDITALREAILELKGNRIKRDQLAAGALERSRLFDINLRIRKMMAIMGNAKVV